MATEDMKDMNDYNAGFSDERAAPGGDEIFDVGGDEGGGDSGGMNLDAAAAGAGRVEAIYGAVQDGAAAADKPADDNSASSAASTGGNPDTQPIERQPEGGGEGGASSAADNGGGGNASPDASGAADVTLVIGAVSPEDSPADAAPNTDEPTSEADKQRARSWEGRLKARESDLDARKAELDALAKELEAKGKSAGQQPGEATGEALEEVAERTNDPSMMEAAEELSQQVEAGKITPEDAINQLKEDFGEPFVNLIQTVATAAAGKALEGMRSDMDKIRGDTDEVISHLRSRQDREHFSEIAAVFPDFNEIGKSPEFAQFIDSLPPEEKAAAEQTKQDGSAADVIALLRRFEESKKGGGASEGEQGGGGGGAAAPAVAAAPVPPTVGPSESEIDAAAGVRGGGMQLPQEPTDANNNDYAAAWDDAPDVRGRA